MKENTGCEKHLRIEHVDCDFSGGLDGPEVGHHGVAVQHRAGARLLTRRLDEDLVRRSGSLAQRPPHVGQLLLQSAALCISFTQTKETTEKMSKRRAVGRRVKAPPPPPLTTYLTANNAGG